MNKSDPVVSLVASLEKNGHAGLKLSEAKVLVSTFGNRAREIIDYYRIKQ